MKIDRRALVEDTGALLRLALDGWQSQIWTAIPGFVVAVNMAQMTCQVQPTIRCRFTDQTGVTTWRQIPVLLDVPIVVPSGGGFTLTFPLEANDEVLVMFSSRCIDAWWQLGGINDQTEYRMHDLSDGFAIPGPKSLKNVIPSISATEVQLRNNAGTTHIGIDGSGDINVTSAGTLTANVSGIATINASAIHLNGVIIDGSGNVTLPETSIVTAYDLMTTFTNGTYPQMVSAAKHQHTGVANGGSISGPVATGT